jgi:uncharacterized protein RhaS with RHS repeats
MVAFIEAQTSSKSRANRNPRSGSRPHSPRTPYPRFSDARVGYRFYDNKVGKWTTQDPLGVDAGLNAYTYCANNSVNLIDSFGLDYRYRYIGLHRIVEIKKNNGNSCCYEWSPNSAFAPVGTIGLFIAGTLDQWLNGEWRRTSCSGIPAPWHVTTPEQTDDLVHRFEALASEPYGTRGYNLYWHNSFQAPGRQVDDVLNHSGGH